MVFEADSAGRGLAGEVQNGGTEPKLLQVHFFDGRCAQGLLRTAGRRTDTVFSCTRNIMLHCLRWGAPGRRRRAVGQILFVRCQRFDAQTLARPHFQWYGRSNWKPVSLLVNALKTGIMFLGVTCVGSA